MREYSKEIVPEIFDDSIKTSYPNFKIEKIGNLRTQEKKSKEYYREKCKKWNVIMKHQLYKNKNFVSSIRSLRWCF